MYKRFRIIMLAAFMQGMMLYCSGQSRPLVQRVTDSSVYIPKENITAGNTDTLIVKFTEGTNIIRKKGEFRSDTTKISTTEKFLLDRNELSYVMVKENLSAANTLFATFGEVEFSHLFTNSRKYFDKKRNDFEMVNGEELADLNLYYKLIINYGPGKGRNDLIEELKALKIVETVYPIYHPQNAAFVNNYEKLRPVNTSADFSAEQYYLSPSPTGVDAIYSWGFAGGKGKGIRIIDIEYGWTLTHEDLKAPFIKKGSKLNEIYTDHGTAVSGELIGQHNGFGVNGICPDIDFGVMQVNNDFITSDAILAAAAELRPGDIILIEMHIPGPKSSKTSSCNKKQFEYVPVEYVQDCFDAIKYAISKGIIVVEAAGNGQMNLDDPIYKKLFDPKYRNSGSIMVGADNGGDGYPACFTNYGNRINYYSWGGNVVTTGYGNYGVKDPMKLYTKTFGGTSSASPIIAGIIANLQGIRKSKGMKLLTAANVLAIIKGIEQSGEKNKQIGTQPDLKITMESPSWH